MANLNIYCPGLFYNEYSPIPHEIYKIYTKNKLYKFSIIIILNIEIKVTQNQKGEIANCVQIEARKHKLQ